MRSCSVSSLNRKRGDTMFGDDSKESVTVKYDYKPKEDPLDE